MSTLNLLSAAGAWPYVILVAFIGSMVAIAFYARKQSTSVNSFLLANRGLGGWMTAFAYGTTYFSAVVFIGYAGKFGMTIGLSSVWIGLANALIGSLLAWIVLARRTRDMTHKLGTKTMPEFFEKRYGDKNIKLYASIVIFIFLIPYSTSVYQGLAYLFEMVFGLGFTWCVLLMAVLTAMYLFSGGYLATALSDFVQGIIMIIGVIIMVIMMFKTPEVGPDWLSTLTEKGFGLAPSFNGKLINSSGFNLIILICLTSFGIWALPQSVHKFYAVKDNAAIKKATVISTIFALIIGVCAYLNGGLSRLFFDAVPPGGFDSVVPQMLERANLGGALLGLIMVLVLSASMSTLSSLSLSGASAVAVDVYKGYVNKNAEDKKVKFILRLFCLLFVALSALLAVLKVDAIVTLMSLSWGTLAGCFIGPYVLGLYSKKITRTAAWSSMIGGIVITFTLVLVFGLMDKVAGDNAGDVLKKGINRSPLIGVITMASSVIITAVVSLFTKPPTKEVIEKCF